MNEFLDELKKYGEISADYIQKADKAHEAFLSGYNCSQALLIAFSDGVNVPINEALKLVQPFGGGMSRLREVCGAVSGGVFVIGALYGSDESKDYGAKAALYELTQRYVKRFEAINGSYICRDLLGLSNKSSSPTPDYRNKEYYKKRPCADLVWISAILVAQIIEEEKRG